MPEDNGIWTKESILKYVDERFDTLKEQTKESDNHLKEYLSDKITAQKELVRMAMASSQTAVHKAEVAMEKRLEGMNEFREQMNRQEATFMTKDAYHGDKTNIMEKVVNIQDRVLRIENTAITVKETKVENKKGISDWIGYILFGLTVISFVIVQFTQCSGGS